MYCLQVSGTEAVVVVTREGEGCTTVHLCGI